MKTKKILIVLFSLFALASCGNKSTQNQKGDAGADKYDFLLGTYSLDKEFCEDCGMILTIEKEVGKYVYRLTTTKQDVKGLVNVLDEEHSMSVQLPEIKWADYKEGVKDPDELDQIPSQEVFGINFEYDADTGTLMLQNYGNTLNYFLMFEECDCKYIILKK